MGAVRATAEEVNAQKDKKPAKRKAVKKIFDDRLKELNKLLKESKDEILEEVYNREGGFGRQSLKDRTGICSKGHSRKNQKLDI